ncbi:MAG: DNA repair exonuclease [Thermoplasmata archaeon]|nr:DNA repair exonuclease [Thermoplasmata archaeon]
MDGRNFVFAHLADAHVGAWPRAPQVRRALRESVLRALAVVDERDCEFLLISGDLFDTPVPDPTEVAPVAAALKALVQRGRRIYVIYGSHDYVAHRTSWLDVLAETGIFLRAAPEAVRAEGTRFTLPFRVDEPTGARIAGISGRALGLDRSYFRSVDSERFRAEPGFKVFQFHAAVREYLPPHLAEHIEGVPREDLPGGCDYYAGGHIHYSYVGSGPEGGLLVNPGAVFGTSRTDLAYAQQGRTHQGLVIVTVREGVPSAEFVDTAPKGATRVFEVDVSGKSADEAKLEVARALEKEASPGTILFARIQGKLADGTLSGLGLSDSFGKARALGASAVQWDVRDVSPSSGEDLPGPESEARLETECLGSLSSEAPERLAELRGPDGLHRLHALLKELFVESSEGESRQTYQVARTEAALEVLGVRSRPTSREEP